MKKFTAVLVAVICAFAISGCGSNRDISNNPDESSKSTSNEAVTPEATGAVSSETAWTVQEIEASFSRINPNTNWTVIDCVAVTDFAFERVGVVLFVDNEEQTSNVAFVDKDGYCQRCGIYAKTYLNSELTYCGNGVVTFKLETEEGTSSNCKITFSTEGANVYFVVEDDL